MRLASFRVQNYKSFGDDNTVHQLSPRRNVIVGANNSGKTALLEALSLRVPYEPHKTANLPRGSALPAESQIWLEIAVSGEELRQFLLRDEHQVPYPVQLERDAQSIQRWLNDLFVRPEIRFATRGWQGHLVASKYPAFDLFDNPPMVPIAGRPGGRPTAMGKPTPLALQLTPNGKSGDFRIATIHSGGDIATEIGEYACQSIYYFDAERLGIARSPAGMATELKSDASNLPEVLHNLQSTSGQFQKFISLVNGVLPDVREIGAYNIENNQVEIRVSSYPPELERDDLHVSLAHCGTGVGQVLAVIYVLFASKQPRTIIIDEPNSFLHPRAARRLMQIIRSNERHQFIISTHSPEVIAAAAPERILLARWRDGQTELKESDESELNVVRDALDEVGARLSDVFGTDRVLWVEGITEERCYPLLIKEALDLSNVGTAVLGVPATGDLHGRRKQLVMEIYRKLSTASVLLPVSVGFLFDRETLTDAEIEDAHRQSNGMLHFTSRRTFENYLLKPDAIVAVLNSEESERAEVTTEQVEKWIVQRRNDPKYLRPYKSEEIDEKNWIVRVNAAELLTDIFWELRIVAYAKAEHSYKIFQRICAAEPNNFQELADILKELLA